TPLKQYDNDQQRDQDIINNPILDSVDKTRAYPGYTFVTTGFLHFPYLVNMEGKVVYQWKVPVKDILPLSACLNPLRKGLPVISAARAFPNGDALVQFSDFAAPYGCALVKVDKHGKVLWKFAGNVHHDFHIDGTHTIYTIAQQVMVSPPKG